MQNVIDNIYLFVGLGMAGTFLLSVSIVFFYIRYQKKFIVQREKMQKAELDYQVKLLYATFQSQENERKRIGQDMHDDVCGNLANLRLVIGKCERGLTDQVTIDTIKKSQQMIDALITRVRDISHDLSPSGLEVFGLVDTLENLCDNIRNSSGINISIHNHAVGALEKIDINTSLALYRVMQELLSNTIKHAVAKSVDIEMQEEPNAVLINYSDNGKGFDQEKLKSRGIGLHNIKSRLDMINSTFVVKTAPGGGFGLSIRLPLA